MTFNSYLNFQLAQSLSKVYFQLGSFETCKFEPKLEIFMKITCQKCTEIIIIDYFRAREFLLSHPQNSFNLIWFQLPRQSWWLSAPSCNFTLLKFISCKKDFDRDTFIFLRIFQKKRIRNKTENPQKSKASIKSKDSRFSMKFFENLWICMI